MSNKIIDKYTTFLTNNPTLIFGICLILIILGGIWSGLVKNETFENRDSIPDSEPVIKAYNRFSDDFGSTDTVLIVLESDPKYMNSNEPRDMRDPEVIQYVERLEKTISKSQQVETTNSAAKILRNINKGFLPKTNQKIKQNIQENPILNSYISEDASMQKIVINPYADYNEDEIYEDLLETIQINPEPPGVKTNIAGSSIANVIVNNSIGDDMNRTSILSLIMIVVILIIVMWSFKYGTVPLITIIVGIIWTMGYIGISGQAMNSATSGVISMILGIGIDFGIQIITRFRQEMKQGKHIHNSMKKTLDTVIGPMTITTIAALIGFNAMSLGQLKILEQLGTMMAYGVFFCYLAAITMVPSTVILIEKISSGIRLSKKNKNKKTNKMEAKEA